MILKGSMQEWDYWKNINSLSFSFQEKGLKKEKSTNEHTKMLRV